MQGLGGRQRRIAAVALLLREVYEFCVCNAKSNICLLWKYRSEDMTRIQGIKATIGIQYTRGDESDTSDGEKA